MGSAVSGGSIDYEDVAGMSPKLTTDRSGRVISRVGIIDWDDANSLIAECFPPAPALPGVYPANSYLYCDSLEIEPMFDGMQTGTSGGIANYTHARASITYKMLEYESSDLLTRKYSFSTESMMLPASGVRWQGDAVGKNIESEDVSAMMLIPMTEHSITFNRATSVPFTAIRANIGMVNDGAFEGAADQTLLFMGAEVSFTFSSDGTLSWTVEYKFSEKRTRQGANVYGWNHFYRNKDKSWLYLLDDADNRIYSRSANFGDLW